MSTPNGEVACYWLPHRWQRGAWYAVMVALGALVTMTGDSGIARRIVGVLWLLVIVVVEIRTSRLRIVVEPARIRSFGVLRNRSVVRDRVDYVDLDLPVRGAFTPGGGERLVAVLNDGRRLSLTFDATRGPGRHCRHYSDLTRSLNDFLAVKRPERTDT